MNDDDTWRALAALANHPGYGDHGRTQAAACATRYLAGEPLVRYHRTLDRGWSYLCPVPACLFWHTGHRSEQVARVQWTVHARRHPGFVASWPNTAAVALPASRVAENAQMDLLVELEAVA